MESTTVQISKETNKRVRECADSHGFKIRDLVNAIFKETAQCVQKTSAD